MATSTGVSCGICLKNGQEKAAIIWCAECESALCHLCKDQHDQSNKTINHKTTAVEELYKNVQIPIRSRNSQIGIAHKFNVEKSETIDTTYTLPAILAFCQLPNKDFVFVGGDGVFSICNNEGSLKDRFSLFTVTDITSIDNSTVAVSGGQFSISLVDIEKKTRSKRIPTKEGCFGMEHHMGILYLCVYGHGLFTANLSDYTVTKFYLPGYVSVSYVTMSKSNICMSDMYEDFITLLDPSANIIWRFIDKELLQSPTHLTSDSNGNIYVLGQNSYNVVFISADGKQSRQLLNREDGIEKVADIHYDKDRKVLIIINMSGSVIMYNCP